MKGSFNSRDRGNYAEELVHQYFLKKGFQVRYHQKKIFGVEFDWIFQNQDHLVYVEVKSVRSTHFFLQRWPQRQRERFLRVASILAGRGKSIFYLALVDYEDKIFLFNVGSELN